MLWLALYFDQLPLQVFERLDTRAELQAYRPRAVCEQRTILLANTLARSLGIQAGMPRASALALQPGLELLDRDPAREHAALGSLTNWALQFTPSVCHPEPEPSKRKKTALRPGQPGLLLEVEASLRLFGGLEQLIRQVKAGLSELAYHASLSVAPNAVSAWMLARHQDGHRILTLAQLDPVLNRLPLHLLSSATRHLPALESIGIRQIGALCDLPRAGLSRRFGPALLEEIDQARGLRPDPRVYLQAPPEFLSRLDLLAQVEQTDALLFAARRLLVELAGWLAARHAAVQQFTLEAEHDHDHATSRFELRLSEPSRDPDRLTGLLREHLAVVRLPAPVYSLRLKCTEILPLTGHNDSLFPVPEKAQQSLGRLLERLQARLGPGHIKRLHLVADHRPEAAYRDTTIERLDIGNRVSGENTATLSPMLETGVLPRPLWLLSQPLRLTERNNQPWSNSPLALLAGPERIESGWWDQHLVQRDYFIAEDRHQMLYWIYRERNASPGELPGWFVHGRFG